MNQPQLDREVTKDLLCKELLKALRNATFEHGHCNAKQQATGASYWLGACRGFGEAIVIVQEFFEDFEEHHAKAEKYAGLDKAGEQKSFSAKQAWVKQCGCQSSASTGQVRFYMSQVAGEIRTKSKLVAGPSCDNCFAPWKLEEISREASE